MITKKVITIMSLGMVFLVLIIILFYNTKEDCKLKCANWKYIPCNSSNDCKFERMSDFCGGMDKVILISGLDGYCKDGYCHSYGCGGAPKID